MKRGLLAAVALAALAAAAPAHAADRQTTVVVTLAAPPLAQAHAQSRVLSAAARRAPLDVRSPTSRSYTRSLAAARRSLQSRVAATIPGARVGWEYAIVANGFSVTLPRSRVASLSRVPGVAKVWPSVRYRAALDRSVPLIGAPALWNPDLSGAGNGVLIGILDDGVEATHPFFSPTGFTAPPGFPKGQTAYTTAKVVVARAFVPRFPAWRHASKPFDPELSGHGTHVAGIASGINGATASDGRRLTGVAPRAQIGNYKVLTIPTDADVGLDGNSPEIAAGIEAAVADGMDVINLSLGEPEIQPTRDIVTAAIDAAADAGVVPVLAAGNDFPEFGRGSVGSPGAAAKAITVGAVTKARTIADFSSSGPTPLSLRLKPEVAAPGASILSSVPVADGMWESYSGTSMAAPHVAGAAALLKQRHPEWTVAQVKSALALTGDVVRGVSPLRQGGGVINVPRANDPRVFAEPVNLSFGLMRGGAALRRVTLTDAGGGAAAWTVTVEQASGAAGATLTVPPVVTVPGALDVTLTAGSGTGDVAGWVVLTNGSEQRRIAYWGRLLAAPQLPPPSFTLKKGGAYRGNLAGRAARVERYGFPEGGDALGVRTSLAGPEQVFRFVLDRPVANFGVVVLSGSAQPRIVVAGDEQRLVGYTALPIHLNPYLREFYRPAPIAAAVFPVRGAYDVVFDSPSAALAGPFTFRFWVDDVKPPVVKAPAKRLRRGSALVLSAVDAGAGIDPRTLHAWIDGRPVSARYDAGRGRILVPTQGLRAGTHTLRLQVSDHQEAKNNENQARILPNTAFVRARFTVR